MTTLDLIVASAVGQLLAAGVIFTSYILWRVSVFLWTFGKAVSETRVSIVCERKT